MTAPTNIREARALALLSDDDDPTCPDCHSRGTYWHAPARDWACRDCQKVFHRDNGPAFLAQRDAAQIVAEQSTSWRETIALASVVRDRFHGRTARNSTVEMVR